MMRVFLADLLPFTWWLSCAPWTRTRAYAVSAVCGLEPGALVPYRVAVEVAEGHADLPVADFDVSNFVAVLVVFDAYDFALAVEAGCEVVYVCVGWDVLRVVHVVIIGAVGQHQPRRESFLFFFVRSLDSNQGVCRQRCLRGSQAASSELRAARCPDQYGA